jgi:hypothetical protein
MPPISLGAINNQENAYVHLKLRFRADSTEGYPNVFQTAPVNRGMRMEISGSTAGIIVPDLSVPGGLKGFTLTTALKIGQRYVLEVEALNGAYVRATLDGRSVADYASSGLSMETSQLLVGGGFDASRAFRGEVDNISVIKGNIAHQSPEKFTADNRVTINVAPYIYGKTPPVSLGEIKSPDNAYVHLKLRFRADSTEGYPNVFQTAPVNRGMRMEISGSTAGIIVPDLSVPGGLKGFTLTTALKTGRWYTLEVGALNGSFVHATLDGHLVVDYASTGLSMETSQLLVGAGFDASRTFRGEIENISITKGNRSPPPSRRTLYAFYALLLIGLLILLVKFLLAKKEIISYFVKQLRSGAYTRRLLLVVWLVALTILGVYSMAPDVWVRSHLPFTKSAVDSRDTINVAPYIYGKMPPISLGAINNQENAYVHLKLRFRADSTEGYPNVFQTAPVNRGMRMEIYGSTAVIIFPIAPGVLKGFTLTTALKTGQWYALEVEALNGAFVRATLDGEHFVPDNFFGRGLSMETSQVLVGGVLGFDPLRVFRGEIENISITKGNIAPPPSRGPLYTFYLLFLIGLFTFLANRRGVTYTSVILLSIIAGFFYYFYCLIANGYLPSPFVYTKSETFMDLFNPMYWAYNDGRYTDWGAVYPPLSFLILKLINFVFAGSVHGSAAVMRDNSLIVIAGFILIYLAVPAAVLKTKLWEVLPTRKKILIYFVIICSTPMLFALERGNLIVLCLLLLAFVLSRIGFVRCLCIALLINIKPYFALLMIYYIARKNWKGFATCVALSGLIFAVSGLLLDNHFLVFFVNLLDFSRANGVFSLKEMLALPSSISAFSYALKHPDGVMLAACFLSPVIIAIIVYVIEATKWGVIAISLAILSTRSSVMRDAEIFTLLVVVITNLGVSVGGYSLIFYIALIPVFIKMRAKWLCIGLLVVMAMPLDIIPLMSEFLGKNFSYLSDSYVGVQWTLGLGSVIRPVANFLLLLLLSWEFFSRNHGATAAMVYVRRIQLFFSRSEFYIGLGSVLFAVLLYNGIFFNRYFPLTEGWFSAYAHLIRQGLIPYRDFYLFITPLYPLQLAAFQSVFGESFIALRILGIVVVLLLSLFLYLILARRFPPLVSAIATLTAIIYYQSGVAHITYDFTQFFTLFVLAATYLIIRYADNKSAGNPETKRNEVTLLFLAGILVSLAFLTKQSNGTLVVVFSIMAVALATAGQNLAYRLRNISVYMLGMALPVLIMGIWLYFVGALTPFIDQVVFGAIAAKGSIWSILFSWIGIFINKDYLIQLKTALLYMSPLFALSLIGTVFVKRPLSEGKAQMINAGGILLFFALFVVTIGFAYYSIELSKPWMMTPGIKLAQGAVAVSTALAVVLLLFSLMQSLAGFSFRRRDLAVSAIMTIGLVFGNGTSPAIGEVGIFLGFALVLAFLMSLPNVYGIAKIVVGVTCLSFIFFLTNSKVTQPYAWWLLSVPGVRESVTQPALPLLTGFRLSPDSTKVLEDTTRIIQTHSRPGDDVFTFPHIPVFYVLADRWPHSKVVVSWFDFLPPTFARAEARRLLASPPEIIVNLKLPEAVWDAHERLFHDGKPLGQRDIQAVIMGLTEERKLYQLDFTREVSPGSVLEVWHKIPH